MTHYSVDFTVSGFKSVQVEANNAEEAERKAKQLMDEVNFGELEEVQYKVSDIDLDMNYTQNKSSKITKEMSEQGYEEEEPEEDVER